MNKSLLLPSVTQHGFFPRYPPKAFKAPKGKILEVTAKMNGFLNDHIKMRSYCTYQISKGETLRVSKGSGDWTLRAAGRRVNWYIYKG